MGKWEKVRLGDVCEVLDSMRVPVTASNRKAGIYPYYGANGIQDYVDEYIFDDELVLLAEDGGNFGSKTRPISYRVSGKCWVNNHAHVLKPKDMLNIDYLCYSIMFYDVAKIISGTTRAKLNQSAMRKMTIPLPPLEIQQKIAATLDTAAALLKLRQQQMAELEALIQSVFYQMFGDPVLNHLGWDKLFIEAVVADEKNAIKAGPFGSALKKEFYVKNGYKIYGQEQVINGDVTYGDYYITQKKYLELENCAVKAGDVLISMVGTYGKLLIIPESFHPGIINPRLIKITFDNSKVNTTYFKYFFTSASLISSLARNTHGGTMAILNLGIVRKIKMPVPPLNMQNQFAAIVQKIDQQKALVQQSIDETQTLFDSLMSRYFD